MSNDDRDSNGSHHGGNVSPPEAEMEVLGADTLIGKDVRSPQNEDLGDIKEIMLDMRSGTVGYAVLSLGRFLGITEKLVAVPWHALKLDAEHRLFVLNVTKDQLKNAPGFDTDHWPDMADEGWQKKVHSFYAVPPWTKALRVY